MTAAVTNSLREYLLALFKSDIDSDGVPYHIGIARSEPITAADAITTANVGSVYNQEKFRHTLQSVKVLSNVSHVVPTVTWASDDTYEAYDNNNPFQTNFYVVNSLREVFLCVEQGKFSNGTARPVFDEPFASAVNNTTKSFRTSDGYLWKYLYKISNLAYGTFRTKSYTPVKKITNTNTTIPEEIVQLSLQDSATSGQILSIAIDSAGINYSNPTITISGNGAGAKFVAEVTNNRIVNVRCDSNGFGGFLHGQGYDYAKVVVTDPEGGTGAKLRAILSPKGGVNDDPTETLKSRALMLQTDFIGTEEDTIVANDTEFYQVAVMKGLQVYDGDSAFVGNTGQAAKSLTLGTITGSWIENDTFTNAEETTSGKVFYLDGTTLYYYQDEETGFENFVIGENLINTEGGTAQILAKVNPDVNPYSGEILYINTLDTAITREAAQTEDIRIVIQLG